MTIVRPTWYEAMVMQQVTPDLCEGCNGSCYQADGNACSFCNGGGYATADEDAESPDDSCDDEDDDSDDEDS